MFAYLNGVIAEKSSGNLVVDVGGVGFRCSTTYQSLMKLPETGVKAKVFTYMNVREDAIDLFGFADEEELSCFKLLLSVNGIGPKVALTILSDVTVDQFYLAVSKGDFKLLTKVPGIGPKIAQRIILELKDKVSDKGVTPSDEGILLSASSVSSKNQDAISALMALGFSASEAKSAVGSLNTADMPVEDVVRIALKMLMK